MPLDGLALCHRHSSHLSRRYQETSHPVSLDVDATSADDIERLLSRDQPDVVINCLVL